MWIKKNGGQFDVTMGAYDGAEVCELVGTFLLFQLSQHYKGRFRAISRRRTSNI